MLIMLGHSVIIQKANKGSKKVFAIGNFAITRTSSCDSEFNCAYNSSTYNFLRFFFNFRAFLTLERTSSSFLKVNLNFLPTRIFYSLPETKWVSFFCFDLSRLFNSCRTYKSFFGERNTTKSLTKHYFKSDLLQPMGHSS